MPVDAPNPVAESGVADLAMIVGTGGTTGRPKGVMLTNANLETMTALTLMGYPFRGRPTYLALAPLTHAAGVLCFPVLALGGEIVIMRAPDVGGFLALVERHRVTHTFLPPTLIYMVLGHEALDTTDLGSLQCFWYGAAPMSAARLEEALTRIGPVMAQLFGQTEAPMMISMMPPADHVDADGSPIRERLSSAGRPAPLVQVAVLDEHGREVPGGERGEIGVRGSLVMAGYYKNPEATAEAGRHGWHHTGDIGFLDPDGFLHIVDRAKDMIISGGFNVYSTEVEQALLAHPDVQDCAVIGVPDDKWGERVVAVVQPYAGRSADPDDVRAFVRERIGGVKAPKEVLVWGDLPRSKVGKVLKVDIRSAVLSPGWPQQPTSERSRSASSASSACHTAGRGTDRTLRVSVGINAERATRPPMTAMAADPPTDASRAPPSSGATQITDIDRNCEADCARPWRWAGVCAIR